MSDPHAPPLHVQSNNLSRPNTNGVLQLLRDPRSSPLSCCDISGMPGTLVPPPLSAITVNPPLLFLARFLCLWCFPGAWTGTGSGSGHLFQRHPSGTRAWVSMMSCSCSVFVASNLEDVRVRFGSSPEPLLSASRYCLGHSCELIVGLLRPITAISVPLSPASPPCLHATSLRRRAAQCHHPTWSPLPTSHLRLRSFLLF